MAFVDVGAVEVGEPVPFDDASVWRCGRLDLAGACRRANLSALRGVRLLAVSSTDVATLSRDGRLEELCANRILLVDSDAGSCLCVVDGTLVCWSSPRTGLTGASSVAAFAAELLRTHSAAAAVERYLGRPLGRLAPPPPCGGLLAPTGHGAGKMLHATGVFVIRDGHILVGRKRTAGGLAGDRWYLPGGKLIGGETPTHCAIRELREETGLVAKRPRCIGRMRFAAGHGDVYEFTQFLVRDARGEAQPGDDLASCAWHPINDLVREEHFPLTWAQLQLSAITGAIPEARATIRSWEASA